VIPATIEEALSAKAKVAEMLKGSPELVATGIAVLDGGFGVKVNLRKRMASPLPADIDGVPLVVEVTGNLSIH